MYYPNSSRCASSGTPLLQCSSALFLNSSTELLLYPPYCASCSLVTHATSLLSALLNLLSFSCTFSFIGHTSFFSCYTFCGLITCTAFFFLIHNEHSLHLCPFSSHLKYSTSTIPTFLIVLPSTLHYIILLLNTSNLFWEMFILFSPSLLFLQLQARYLNPLQLKHNFPLLPSSFSLSLVREYFSLSRLLISKLYCCKDMVLRLCKDYRFND